jgi:indole-3-glycerol phosphate synthase
VALRQAGASAALVGTHLMRERDLETATRELLAPLAEA